MARKKTAMATTPEAIAPTLPDPFVCDELPTRDGHTWTPTSRLGGLLAEAEMRFGPRDTAWTILGVEFGRDLAQPQVWYPGNRRHIAIQLTLHARASPCLLLYQLAHEVVHTLAPTGGANAPIVEEGIATLFAQDVMAREFPGTPLITAPLYSLAAGLTRDLFARDADLVRRLRERRPRFCDWTADFLLAHAPSLAPEAAASLCGRFPSAP